MVENESRGPTAERPKVVKVKEFVEMNETLM